MAYGDRPGGAKPAKAPRKVAVRVKAPKPVVVKAPRGDVASSGGNYGMPQAKKAASSAPVQRATRAVYGDQPTAQKRAILKHASGSTGQVVRREHARRELRNMSLRSAQAKHDVYTPADQKAAYEYFSSHPKVLGAAKDHKGLVEGALFGVDRLLSGKTLEHAVSAAANVAGSAVAAVPKAGAEIGTSVGNAITDVLHTGTGPGGRHSGKEDYADTVGKVTKNFGRDIVDLPANAIPSLYVPAKKAVEGDPVGAGKMLAQPFVDLAKHPGKSFVEHPLGSALLVAGVKGGAGRGAGKALRTAPVKSLRRVGSVDRPSATRTVPGTTLAEPGRYSPDVISKGVQVAAEKVRPKAKTMSQGQIHRRVDENRAMNEDLRRAHRSEAVNAASEAITNTDKAARVQAKASGRMRVPKVKATAATTLAAQNIARPADLRAYHAELAQEAQHLTGDKLRRNKDARKQIEKAIKRVDVGGTEVAARKYAELNTKLQQGLVDRGLLDSHQAEKARLMPYAVRHMDARTLAPHETGAALQDAQLAVRDAHREVRAQHRLYEDSLAGAGVARGRAQILSREVGGSAAEKAAQARSPQFQGGARVCPMKCVWSW